MPEHSVITDPNIHEPKGVAAATAGQVYVADGAGSGAWEDKLPDQTGNSGKFLTTDGSAPSWGTATYFAKAEINNGTSTTQSLVGASNIASCSRTSTSTYTVTFTNAAPNTQYTVLITLEESAGVTLQINSISKGTGSFTFTTYRGDTATARAMSGCHVVVFT